MMGTQDSPVVVVHPEDHKDIPEVGILVVVELGILGSWGKVAGEGHILVVGVQGVSRQMK